MSAPVAGSVVPVAEEEVMPWELDRARSRTTDPAPLPPALAAQRASVTETPASAASASPVASPLSPASLNAISEEEDSTPVWHDSLSPIASATAAPASAASPKTQTQPAGFDAASIPMGSSSAARPASASAAAPSSSPPTPSSASASGAGRMSVMGGGLNSPSHRNTGALAAASARGGPKAGTLASSSSALAVLPIATLNPALSPVTPSASPPSASSTPRNHSGSFSSSTSTGSSSSTGGSIVKKGILIKLGGNILNKWKSRFFVLRDDADFTYYPTERDWLLGKMPPLGRMRLNVDLHCWSESPKELEWKFVSTDKTVVVRGTLQDKREWYEAIDTVVAKLAGEAGEKGEGRAPSPSLSSSSSVKSRGSAAGGGGNRSRTSSGADAGEGEDEVGDLFTSARENEPVSSNPRAGLARSSSNVGAVDWAPGSSPDLTPLSRSGLDRSSSNGSETSSSGTFVRGGSLSSNSSSGSSGGGASFALPSKFTESEMARIIAKRQGKSRKAQQLFGWDSSELVIKDFSCAIEKHIMLHGRMYVSEHYIGFFTPLFSSLKVVIPIADVLSVCQVNQALIFPNAIKVFVRVHADPGLHGAVSGLSGGGGGNAAAAPAATGESSYFFGSFAPGNRMNAYELITSLINATFDPSAYRIFDPVTTASAGGAVVGRARQISVIAAAAAEAAEEDETNGAEDATTAEDMGEGEETAGAEGASTASVASLDFGEHRPLTSSASATGSPELELKDMHEECFPSLSARAFFKLFLSDAALYNAEAYHKSKGDTEYQASGWKDAKLVEGASAAGWQLVRDTMVRVPVVGSPMGPDSTRVLKVQKQKAEEGRITLETVAVTPDVPFGDCFCLIDQWDITDLGAGAGCRVKIRLGISFVKKNWKLSAIKGMLVSRALGDNQKGFKAFVEGMKAYLASHPAECEAVRKAVDKAAARPTKRSSAGVSGSTVAAAAAGAAVIGGAAAVAAGAAGAKGSAPPSADGSAASASATHATKSPAPKGLAAIVAKLPKPLRDLGLPPAALVGGLAVGGVVVLWMLWMLLMIAFGSSAASSSSASSAAVAAAIVAAGASGSSTLNGTALSSASGSGSAAPGPLVVVASSGLSWPVVLLLTCLVCAVGGLAHRLLALESELGSLRAQVRALSTATHHAAATANSAAAATQPAANTKK